LGFTAAPEERPDNPGERSSGKDATATEAAESSETEIVDGQRNTLPTAGQSQRPTGP